MKENGTLQVLYDGKVVGKLALMAGRKIAFEYSEEWLETGFSIECSISPGIVSFLRIEV